MVVICIFFIVQRIVSEIDEKLLEDNELLANQIQVKDDKNDLLWKIILQVRNELKLTQLKSCPEEEFKNIPAEIIQWINFLEQGTEEIVNAKKSEEHNIH